MTSSRKTAFTLTEVMFAVITLGIGLIMIAAVFPVAIQQTRLTAEEGVASSLAWVGMNQLAQATQVHHTTTAWPSTGAAGVPGEVQPLSTQAWLDIRGNLINPSDPRYAFVPLYRRDQLITGEPADTAQVFIIAVAARNTSTFTAEDVVPASPPINLRAKAVAIEITNGLPDGTPDTITFSQGTLPGATAADLAAIETGAYVIISRDNISGVNAGRMNGRIYRVGNAIDAAGGVWELMPGNDFNPDGGVNAALGAEGARQPDDICAIGVSSAEGTSTTFSGPAEAYIVGRGLEAPGSGGNTFAGPVMDVAAYTGYVYVK